MKLLLDACVLYPTVMREMLLGAAAEGCFQPVWSARILEEWARAARKIGPTGEMQARAEIALVQSRWNQATVAGFEHLEAKLWLPDDADVHVLAAAIQSSADGIVTMNAKDFPKNLLHEEGLQRFDPDGLLMQFWIESPKSIDAVAAKVKSEAERLSGKDWDIRSLMRKARLPRLGKALSR